MVKIKDTVGNTKPGLDVLKRSARENPRVSYDEQLSYIAIGVTKLSFCRECVESLEQNMKYLFRLWLDLRAS